MDLLRLRRERVEAAGDAVVEARADADHQVAVMHGVVGLEGAVHAEHAEPLLVGRRIGAEAHQRGGHREAGRADQLAQQSRGVRAGIDHAAAGVEDRPLRRGHHLDRVAHPLEVALDLRTIGLVLDVALERIGAAGELHVLRDVDDDRAWAAVRGDVEGLVQDARQILDPAHQIIVLGAIAGDAGRVAFLERVRADEMGRHLAGDADQRDRIHQRVGETGDRVGRARAGGHQKDADLAGRAREAFCGMRRALLVAHENVADLVLMEDRVVDRQHRAAGIAEDELDALIFQRLDHHFGAGHVLRHNRYSPLSSVVLDLRQQKRPSRGLGHALVNRRQGLCLPVLQRQRYNKDRHRSPPSSNCADTVGDAGVSVKALSPKCYRNVGMSPLCNVRMSPFRPIWEGGWVGGRGFGDERRRT